MKRLLTILLCLPGLLPMAAAEELVLVENGEARARIVLPASAHEIEQYAAEELQMHLEKISGARLPTAANEEGVGGEVVIAALEGRPELAERLGIDPATLEEEEVVLERRKNQLWLVGRTPRAALYATYTFLQDELGCRWFWPGPEGEYFPKSSTIGVKALSRRVPPSFKFRTFAINTPHYDELTDQWMARQRLNSRAMQSRFPKGMPEQLHRKGFKVAISGHNLTLPLAFLKEHPDYVAEVGGIRSPEKVGRRQPHLCWSNKGVQQALVRQMHQWLADHPLVDVISLSATDHTLFCECSGCKVMAERVSDRWQLLCAKIIRELKPDYPSKEFWALAYQAYRDVPGKAAPLDNVSYCAYNANYLQPLLSSEQANAAMKRDLLAWKALGVPVSLRGYEMIPFAEPMWTPLVRYIMDEKRWLRDHGFAGSSSEVTPYGHPKEKPAELQGWTVNRMTLYAAAQALWNVDATPEQLLGDWMKTIYGPAAKPMLEYYHLMENAWLAKKEQLTYFLHPPAAFAGGYLSPEQWEQAGALLGEAKSLAGPDARRAAQLDLEQRMFENWRTNYSYFKNRQQHHEAWVVATGKTAPALPPFEDRNGKIVEDGTEVRLQWDHEAIHLTFICKDASPDAVLAKYAGRDENVFTDDSIELFIQWEAGGYAHLAFNSVGGRYDARLREGKGFDVDWNPEWHIKANKRSDGWEAEVKIPFKSFGVEPPAQGTRWRAAIKRSRPGARRTASPTIRNSGWPDASYHHPSSFGHWHFVKEAPQRKRVVLYHAGSPGDGLEVELAKRGMAVDAVAHGEETLSKKMQEPPALLLIRYGNGRGVGLSDEWMQNTLRKYLEEGGIVVLAATGPLNLEKWLADDELTVEWSGWEVDPRRRTTSLATGDWATGHNDLRAAFKRRIAPASAYRPLAAERWQALAQLRLRDQSESPYLLKTAVGTGALYITTSNMGYSGGGEIFGRFHPGNAAALLQNLAEDGQK